MVWLAALTGAAHAQEVQIVSARPDSVSVTIYRDLFALVTETRTVDLPKGPVTLVFDGVVDSLIPQSAVIADTQRAVAESNFDFERLTPANLLRNSIGRNVTLTRTNRAIGKASQVSATLVAANRNGVVFRTLDGNEALLCSGIPEKLSFEALPDDLHATPRLSIRLASGAAGKRQVRVSYLAQGFAWSANYLGHMHADSMDLSGWITLGNLTGASLRGAEVQLVAGRLNLLDADEQRGTSTFGETQTFSTDEVLEAQRAERLLEMFEDLDSGDLDFEYFGGCYPLGTTSTRDAIGYIDSINAEDIGAFPDSNTAEALQRVTGVEGEMLDEVVVTGFRASMAVRENLADYQLYRLPVRTDLNARQTKQVAFLQKPGVKIDRFYGVRFAEDEEYPDGEGDSMATQVKIAWRNRTEDGLGEPLPSGIIRMFEDSGSGTVFAGDSHMSDSPVNAPMEIAIGWSPDLSVVVESAFDEPPPGPMTLLTRRAWMPLDLRIINAKPRPVVVEIRQGKLFYVFEDLQVTRASEPPKRKAGDYAWRLTVPANGEARLSYKVGGRLRDEDDF